MNAEFKDISKEAFIIAYKENFGNITIACESAGVGRGQYKSGCDKDPEIRQRLAEIEPEEIMLDFGMTLRAVSTSAFVLRNVIRGMSVGS